MEETPLLNRRITYLPLLNAANRQAINQGDVFMNEDMFTTNGAGRRQTWFEIDGANGNDSWGRQTLFSNIPLLAVQEMTILNNGFSAEYGASTGSAVNIITKSGGSQYHGEFLELWRPSALSAALSGFTAANGASGNDIVNDALGQTARLALRAARVKDALLMFREKTAGKRKDRPSFRLWNQPFLRAHITVGWRSCASIIRSTIRTTCFTASTRTCSSIPIPTESWAGTAFRTSIAFSIAARMRTRSAKPRC